MDRYILLFLIFFSMVPQKIDVYIYESVDENSFAYKFMTSLTELYNANNKNNKVQLNYIAVPKFLTFFQLMSDTANLHTKLAIGAITITEKRKQIYDFSKYMPLKTTLLVPLKTKVTKENWKHSNFRTGYFLGTSQEDLILSVKEKGHFQFIGIPFSNLNDVENKLTKNYLDMMFIEGIDYKSLKKVKSLLNYYDENYNYGIMYPKGSKLKLKLEKYIRYFIRSSTYFNLLRETFGNDVGNELFQFFYKQE